MGIIPAVQFQQGDLQVTVCCWGGFVYSETTRHLTLSLSWLSERGQWDVDYRMFVHVYADVNTPPVAQIDTFPGAVTMPPGNWLQSIYDTITVDMSSVPSGVYQIAIGLYNPVTFVRMPITPLYESSRDSLGVQYVGDGSDGRLFIGEIEVP